MAELLLDTFSRFCFHSIICISYLEHTWAYFTKWNAYFSVGIQSNCYVFYQHLIDDVTVFIWWVQILGWLWEALETLIFPQMAQDQNATQTTSTKNDSSCCKLEFWRRSTHTLGAQIRLRGIVWQLPLKKKCRDGQTTKTQNNNKSTKASSP